MANDSKLARHRKIAKVVAVISILVLIVLGSTLLVARLLRTPSPSPMGSGWEDTPQIRIIMDSTADWARIMFTDCNGANSNGMRVSEFLSAGWLSGNDSDDRIDAGHCLTFSDLTYNSTVVRTGDIVGFFKGNNDFSHTRIYVDVVLSVNANLRQVFLFLILAGAGTTTFEFMVKSTGQMIWQDAETGSSFSDYRPRYLAPGIFFTQPQIDAAFIILLAIVTVLFIVGLNPVLLGRRSKGRAVDVGEGL